MSLLTFLESVPSIISITSGRVFRSANFNYVMKAETRVPNGGPWTDDMYDLDNLPIKTTQLEEFETHDWRAYQKLIFAILTSSDPRKITFIHDLWGKTGKSV